MKTLQKGVTCISCLFVGFVIFLIVLAIVTRSNVGGILFFNQCVIALLASAVAVSLWYLMTREKDVVQGILFYTTCLMLLVVFSIMGPTFIDRSISYHILFYAVEEEKAGGGDTDKMESVFCSEIFDKRYEDALEAGMLVQNPDGLYVPTAKAKLATKFLITIGKLTGTLDTYETMKEEINKNE